MSKENLEGSFNTPFKKNERPEYSAEFDGEGHKINNDDYDFSVIKDLCDVSVDGEMGEGAPADEEIGGGREYNFENIDNFTAVNKPQAEETEDETLA